MANPRRINLDEQAREGSLTTVIIADGAITAPKLASGAVDASSLSDGSVSASKLALDVYGAGLIENPATDAIDVNVDNTTLQIISDVLQVGTIDQSNINLTGDLSFGNNQALSFRVENVVSDPAAGNPGRLVWRTDLNQLRVDDGSSFVPIGSGSGGHLIEDEGVALPQRAVLNFVGTGVTVTDTGSKTEVNVSSSGTGTFAKDPFTVTNANDKTLTLSNTPIADSEVVAWNGVLLRPGSTNDYTISGDTITLNAGIDLTIGDQLLVVYAH